MLIFYLISGLLALLGVFIFMGKGRWLVAGFNPMSPKEKEEFENKYDIKKFQKTLGMILLLLRASFLLFMTNLPFFHRHNPPQMVDFLPIINFIKTK